MAWDGVPLLYMGDEIGLRNDHAFEADPDRAADSRWLHRPPMDWAAAARRHDPETIEGRIFGDVLRLVDARRSAPQLHAGRPLEVVDLGDAGAVRLRADASRAARWSPIHDFADEARTVPRSRLPFGANAGRLVDLLDPGFAVAPRASSTPDSVVIPARGVRWLVERPRVA